MEVSFGERKILESEKRKVPQVVKETKQKESHTPEDRCGRKGEKAKLTSRSTVGVSVQPLPLPGSLTLIPLSQQLYTGMSQSSYEVGIS